MNTNFYEVDLLEKYRQSISKRYRGYNRVLQFNINKLTEKSSPTQAKLQNNQKKQQLSPIIQTKKSSFQQISFNHQKIPNCIVIRSSNAEFSLKQINSQTEVNRKKFMKTKFTKLMNTQSQQQKEKTEENSTRIVQSTVQEFLENKFRFKKRFMKDSVKLGIPEQTDTLFRNQLMMRLQPFSPIIRGEKKNTHLPINKKSKTEYEGLPQQQTKRALSNATEGKNTTSYQKTEQLKRTNSFIRQKSGAQTVVESMSCSVHPPKLSKKVSSQKNKHSFSQGNASEKLSFPKINCSKDSFKQTSKPGQASFNPSFQLQKNRQRFKKTPLLLRYQFDVKNIDSESFVVIEAESQAIIYGYRQNNSYQIASLTKIMTFYVVLRLIEQHKIDTKKQTFQVGSTCSSIGGTSADLYPGQIYTLQSLLYGLMLPSGNDAAICLAAWGGKFSASNPQDPETCITQFVKLMNKEAKNLNLIETRFGNPHGLPHHNGRSTAVDVARLSIVCMKNQLFKKVVQTKSYKCTANTKQGRKRFNEWQNTNKLLRRQGFLGIKTGVTITAGPCLASAYKFKDRTYICVVLRAKKISRRFKETRKILHWCLQKFYKDNLTPQDDSILKGLKRNNAELDSDYSQDESTFRYDVNNSQEFRKRCDIISQM